ncbi:type II and III secretion system protein family protein [Facilibium subflavum]|uniref:type II and III secretion system protein family protein n=1 Tax=Facilibium subflavum TaxID=2219058 RepID=UPI000E6492F8|nr:pilus assembly protein N-terminal domain-containing protein [Facilibium subflavum]
MKLTKRIILSSLVASFLGGYAAEKPVVLEANQAKTIKVDKTVASIFIANPKIANYQIIDNHHFAVYGRQIGKTNYIAYDKQGRAINQATVKVLKSYMKYVQDEINARYSGANVRLNQINQTIFIEGDVPTVEMKDEIAAFVGQSLSSIKRENEIKYKLTQNGIDSGTGGSGSSGGSSLSESFVLPFLNYTTYHNVVNHLKVITLKKEVNVRITIASVSKKVLNNLGVSWSNMGTNGSFILQNGIFRTENLTNILNFLDQNNIGSVLAEPNMTVESGKTGNFFSGGEIPYQSSSGMYGTTVSYKKYGISLSIGATVNDKDIIDLFVNAGISSLDQETMKGLNIDLVPLKGNSITSTIQLRDGQSFVIGGLLNREQIQQLEKIPYIGDIPLFGALFRSMHKSQSQKELIIVVTVNTVHPMNSIQDIQIPDVSLGQSLTTLLALPDAGNRNGSNKQSAQHYAKNGGFDE